MSIDKWLDDNETKEEKKKRNEMYSNLSIEEKKDLKEQKIRDLVKKDKSTTNIDESRKDFLIKVLEFKEWLDNRAYIQGDIERIQTWVENLYLMIDASINFNNKSRVNKGENPLINSYKTIPVKFLDEKTRIALNKKLRGMKKTNSDNYYLRKLIIVIKEKLKDAEYYAILRDILER
ncbi:MAG: hypothetical protein KGD67_07820 [Candidatus Lokiarchaeota archaeon]|nr:hypothetical protein [Candidatus Lokiarchaeota archaeon]